MFLVWAPDAPSVGVAPEPVFANEIASQLNVIKWMVIKVLCH